MINAIFNVEKPYVQNGVSNDSDVIVAVVFGAMHGCPDQYTR